MSAVQDNHAKLADVGMAKMMTLGQRSSRQSVDFAMGTFAWAAPEMLMGEELTPAVDVYSLGVVLWEIVTQVSVAKGAYMASLMVRRCMPLPGSRMLPPQRSTCDADASFNGPEADCHGFTCLVRA